jgi:hypothetical protein
VQSDCQESSVRGLTQRNTPLYAASMVKKLTALRLEPKQLSELERIAKRQDRTVSYIIRKAIDEYIRKEKP